MDFEDSTASEPPDRSPGVADVASPGSTDSKPDHNSTKAEITIDFGIGVSPRDDHARRALSAWADFINKNLALVTQSMRLTGEVRIRIVNDDEMSTAHQRHLGDPTTTDVITFDLAEGDSVNTRRLDVDLLLCADEANRQASELGLPVERELLLYAIHGVLHCLGYDDHTDQDAQAMHALEDQLLESIGVGATYSATPPPQQPQPQLRLHTSAADSTTGGGA